MQEPSRERTGKPRSGTMRNVVRAEKLSQLALALPAAVFVGWLAGAGLDKLLHKDWIYLAGIVLGAVAGFVQIIRMVTSPEMAKASAYDPSEPGGSGFRDEEGKK